MIRWWSVLCFLSLLACRPATDGNGTYNSYAELFSTSQNIRLKDLKNTFSGLKSPELQPLITLDSGWYFELGDTSERLKTGVRSFKGDPVSLPHRVLRPDHPFWYSRTIKIPEAGMLMVGADDGAQLFIDGKQINRVGNVYFPIVISGTLNLTIRVLNNAMAGGLRGVSFISLNKFRDYQSQVSDRKRLKILFEKIMLLKEPTDLQINSVEDAIKSGSVEKIKAAEEVLADFPFFTGPWLQTQGNSTWHINVQSEGKFAVSLKYGESADKLEKEIIQSGQVISFSLTDLKPDTQYFYQLSSAKSISDMYTFDTRQSRVFNFNVWADSQSGWENFQQHIRNSDAYKDAFGIGVGDLVSEGADEEDWRMFFNILSPSSSGRPYYLVPGNHDYDGYYDELNAVNFKAYTNYNPETYFSWTYGNCAFIALNPNESFPVGISKESLQYRWFHEQIESDDWKNATWRFVLLHQPPYSQGWDGYHGDLVIRNLLEPVMERAGIDFILAGHTHDYERLTLTRGKQQTTCLIVGGGGGSLEPPESSSEPRMDTVIKVHHIGRFYVNDRSIRFEVRDLENNFLDSFQQMK